MIKSKKEIQIELEFYKKQEKDLEKEFNSGKYTLDTMNKLIDKNLYWQQALKWVLNED